MVILFGLDCICLPQAVLSPFASFPEGQALHSVISPDLYCPVEQSTEEILIDIPIKNNMESGHKFLLAY